MSRLLLLTNSENGYPEEDRLVINCLTDYGDILVRHPLNCRSVLDSVDAVLIRNIWPTHEYLHEWDALKNHLRSNGIPTYNPLTFRGDIEGKDYLVDLWAAGYPVIPSVGRV